MINLVVAADSGRARIFKLAGRDLQELADMVNPEARAGRRDIEADRSGSDQGGGEAGRHGLRGDHDVKDESARKFAREIAGRLEKERAAHRARRLYLIAPPHFLGVLKGVLDHELAKCLYATVSKDVVRASPETILSYCAAA